MDIETGNHIQYKDCLELILINVVQYISHKKCYIVVC